MTVILISSHQPYPGWKGRNFHKVLSTVGSYWFDPLNLARERQLLLSSLRRLPCLLRARLYHSGYASLIKSRTQCGSHQKQFVSSYLCQFNLLPFWQPLLLDKSPTSHFHSWSRYFQVIVSLLVEVILVSTFQTWVTYSNSFFHTKSSSPRSWLGDSLSHSTVRYGGTDILGGKEGRWISLVPLPLVADKHPWPALPGVLGTPLPPCKYRTQGYLTVLWSSWHRKGTLSYLQQLPYYAMVVLTQETLCLSDCMLPHQILFTLAHISPRGTILKLTLSVFSGPSQKAPALSGQCLHHYAGYLRDLLPPIRVSMKQGNAFPGWRQNFPLNEQDTPRLSAPGQLSSNKFFLPALKSPNTGPSFQCPGVRCVVKTGRTSSEVSFLQDLQR